MHSIPFFKSKRQNKIKITTIVTTTITTTTDNTTSIIMVHGVIISPLESIGGYINTQHIILIIITTYYKVLDYWFCRPWRSCWKYLHRVDNVLITRRLKILPTSTNVGMHCCMYYHMTDTILNSLYQHTQKTHGTACTLHDTNFSDVIMPQWKSPWGIIMVVIMCVCLSVRQYFQVNMTVQFVEQIRVTVAKSREWDCESYTA